MATEVTETVEATFKLLKDEGLALRKRARSKSLAEGSRYDFCRLFTDFKDWEQGIVKEFYTQVEELRHLGGDEVMEYYEESIVLDYNTQIDSLISELTDALDEFGIGNRRESSIRFISRSQDIGNATVSSVRDRHGTLDKESDEEEEVDEQGISPGGDDRRPSYAEDVRKSHSSSTLDSPRHLLGCMEKPKHEIEKFSGDPLKFNQFKRKLKAQVLDHCRDENEKMAYLEQFTEGEAHEIVASYSLMQAGGFTYAMKDLQERYGDCEVMTSHLMEKVMEYPSFKIDETKALDKFSILLRQCMISAKDNESLEVLGHVGNMQAIVAKLPIQLQDRWLTVYEKSDKWTARNRIVELEGFVSKEARRARNTIFGRDALKKFTGSRIQGNQRQGEYKRHRSNLATSTEEVSGKATSCVHCGGSHHLDGCDTFECLSHDEKREYIRMKRLCFRCLQSGHFAKECNMPLKCSKCKKFHPTSMHIEGYVSAAASMVNRKSKSDGKAPATNESALNCKSTNEISSFSASHDDGQLRMTIFPVKVYNNDMSKCKDVFAFVDSGSSCSYITRGLAKDLDMTGVKTAIHLGTFDKTVRHQCEKISGLKIGSIDGKTPLKMPTVYTKDNIPVESYHIPRSKDFKEFPHMDVLKVYDNFEGEIGLLLGSDVSFVAHPLETRCGGLHEPVAIRTPIGWVPYGISRASEEPVSALAPVYRQDHLVEKMFENLTECEFPEKQVNEQKENSIEDMEFMDIAEKSVEKREGKIELELPVKKGTVLQNDMELAEQRLKYLKRRCLRNEEIMEGHKSFMQKLLQKGYAEEVSENDEGEPGKTWYLPHHGVLHPVKKKYRVVFDCAAKFQGTSLNDVLLQGPNLTNSLLDVLFRFRQGSIGIAADIEGMFLQVRVPSWQRDYLRFLWFPEGDVNLTPKMYRMCCHLFGATSSPAAASFALKKAAEWSKGRFSDEAISTVRKNFYVDDCLVSVDDERCASKLIEEVSEICAEGGFNLEKFVSNNRAVLNQIPESKRSKALQEIDLTSENLPHDRTLGMIWNVEDDAFEFNVCLQDKPATHRGILSVRSSIFDPVGFLSPFILPAKMITQEACRMHLGWDEELPDVLKIRWEEWKKEATGLGSFKIKRWISNPGRITSRELHHFSDASLVGYGTVSYVREVYSDGERNVQLLYSKSRVAPLKAVSIPRLELQAARESVKSDATLKNAFEIQFDRTYFWTDSTAVLKYINNRNVRFKTYVANRLEFIHSGSNPDQWNHVAGKENPADYASRGLHISEEAKIDVWFHGPKFLHTDFELSSFQDIVLPESDNEVKIRQLNMLAVTNEDCLFDRFSDFQKLVRTTAWVLRFVNNLRMRIEQRNLQSCGPNLSRDLSLSEIDNAKVSLITSVQNTYFQDDVRTLKQGKGLKHSSSLRNLNPFIDEKGILRVGGRLSRSNVLTFERKYPIILPKSSSYSKLLVLQAHNQFGHIGKNHLVSKILETYWMYGLKQLARKVIGECIQCRRYGARLGEQKMADLPQCRIDPPSSVFADVGLDFFGPIEIKQGRCKLKRYGCLFTCMASRAVHLEVAASLDTDACINAIRRFVARRGTVTSITSDNGRNFVGASRELKAEIKRLEADGIDTKSTRLGIRWRFNTPLASHHGGVWETLIKSVRKCLQGLIAESKQSLTEDELITLFCEVENILNSRPLTPEMSDSGDVLTPNHLLIGRQSEIVHPGVFGSNDSFVKRRWRHVQFLASQFWDRWSKEYVRRLNERIKWQHPQRNLAVGDLVVIYENAPRRDWPLARVIQTFPDSDGLVRSVKVKTQSGEFRRPIDKLALLLKVD